MVELFFVAILFVIACFILSDALGAIVLKVLAFAFIMGVLYIACGVLR